MIFKFLILLIILALKFMFTHENATNLNQVRISSDELNHHYEESNMTRFNINKRFIRIKDLFSKNWFITVLINNFKQDDVCNRQNECYLVRLLKLRSHTAQRIVKKINCECYGRYTHACGETFCAASKNTCMMLNLINKYSKFKNSNSTILPCSNVKYI